MGSMLAFKGWCGRLRLGRGQVRWPPLAGWLSGLGGAALVAGCAPQIHEARPGPPAQVRYLPPGAAAPAEGATRPVVGPQVSEGRGPPDDWWTLWGARGLDHLVRAALARNPTLASAEARLKAARRRITAATGALYPEVDAGASLQRTRLGASVLGLEAKDFPRFSAYAAGVQVGYDFDLAGGTRWLIKSAVARARYEETVRDAAALSVAGNVVLQALQIASLRAQIRVVEVIIAADERSLRLVHALHDEGVIAGSDVLIAQSQADRDRTLLPPLRRRLAAARDALAILTGVAPADWNEPDLDLDAFTLPRDLPVALPSRLVHRRPDILAAEAQLDAAQAAVGIAAANRYPRLTLTAALAPQGLLSGPSELTWNLLLGLAAPVYDAGTRRAQQQAAEDDYQAAAAAYRQTVLTAFAQVADTLQALADDADELDAQRRALGSAQASLALATQAYRAGTLAYVEVLEAQRLREQALLGEVQARVQRLVDSVKLLLAAGGRVNVP